MGNHNQEWNVLWIIFFSCKRERQQDICAVIHRATGGERERNPERRLESFSMLRRSLFVNWSSVCRDLSHTHNVTPGFWCLYFNGTLMKLPIKHNKALILDTRLNKMQTNKQKNPIVTILNEGCDVSLVFFAFQFVLFCCGLYQDEHAILHL